MSKTSSYRFTGDPSQAPATRHEDAPRQPEPYVATDELIQAVNLALFLGRPLLLEGEAGCGKTRLTRAVAYELGLPFYPWYVRSTSKAQEGLYTYDAILRLHDVQTRQLEPLSGADEQPSPRPDPRDPKAYRRFGALGKAFTLRDCPAVVLIDEIDKADLDFPNDLLAVLDDEWKFEIPETGEPIQADKDYRPLVVITSNKEKGNLPAPFLRRCIYSYVKFPNDKERLRKIVDAHYHTKDLSPPPALVDAAIDRFIQVRAQENLQKNPGTSEFLDWLNALQGFGAEPYHATMLKATDPMPYPELLFKHRLDLQKYSSAP
jgi:MoxR-like ATPase